MIQEVELKPGTRVAIRGKPIAITLRSNTGTIIGPDIWEGYYVVRLDEPVIYDDVDGREELSEIREFHENLARIAARATIRRCRV